MRDRGLWSIVGFAIVGVIVGVIFAAMAVEETRSDADSAPANTATPPAPKAADPPASTTATPPADPPKPADQTAA